MRLKTDWLEHLHNFRRRELNIIFEGCESKRFNNILELGAGDGFQSRILIEHTKRLVATDFNELRLKKVEVPGIEYMTCDAERVGEQFGERKFDLVFASNLFEHLPDSSHALSGIKKILTDDGVAILVMPSVFWKLSHLFFFYPNLLVAIVEKVTTPGKFKELLGRYVLRKKFIPNNETPSGIVGGNNPKGRRGKVLSKGILWPIPHGTSGSNLEELFAFRRRRWLNEFASAGFSVLRILKGPVASGYGFGFDSLRHLLERMGFTSEYIYILKKEESNNVVYPFAQSL